MGERKVKEGIRERKEEWRFSFTVLGSYTQLIALPTEDEGQDIWQLYRACEKKGENYELQRPEQHRLL